MPESNPSEFDLSRPAPVDSESGTLHIDHGGFLAYRRRVASRQERAHAESATPTIVFPTIVFLGGFKSDMTGGKATALDTFCYARNLNYLRFDYSGHGVSSGDFLEGSITRWTADALAVIDKLTTGPLILIGSSMGGWIMLLAALQRRARVAGLIGIAAAPDFTEALIWQSLSADERRRLMSEGRLEQPSEYSDAPYVITRKLIEDGRSHLLLGRPIALDCKVRLLHGMRDSDVPHAFSLQLAQNLDSADVAVTLIKDGDHRLSRPQDLLRLCEAVDELI